MNGLPSGVKCLAVGAPTEDGLVRVEVAVDAQPQMGGGIGRADRRARWRGRVAAPRRPPPPPWTICSVVPIGGFHDADPGIRRTQQRQAGGVSVDQAGGVQFHRHDGFGPGRTLTEGVAGGIEIAGRQRMQAKHAGLFRQRPLRVVRHVVPLPHRIELVAVEVVVCGRMPAWVPE